MEGVWIEPYVEDIIVKPGEYRKCLVVDKSMFVIDPKFRNTEDEDGVQSL